MSYSEKLLQSCYCVLCLVTPWNHNIPDFSNKICRCRKIAARIKTKISNPYLCTAIALILWMRITFFRVEVTHFYRKKETILCVIILFFTVNERNKMVNVMSWTHNFLAMAMIWIGLVFDLYWHYILEVRKAEKRLPTWT